MNLDEWKLIFITITLIIIISTITPLVMALLPNNEGAFIALAVLGEKGAANQYFPENDPNIQLGETVNWIIYLHNDLGKTQYVSIKFKLLYPSESPPNSTSCSPSLVPHFFEIRRTVNVGETWLYPISWSLEEVIYHEDKIEINKLLVNDNNLDASFVGSDGQDLSIVTELWIYNEDINDFEFRQIYDDEPRCVWNRVWFNLVLIE